MECSPSEMAEEVEKNTVCFKHTCVETLEARVISRLPLRPKRGGMRMLNLFICTNTSHFYKFHIIKCYLKIGTLTISCYLDILVFLKFLIRKRKLCMCTGAEPGGKREIFPPRNRKNIVKKRCYFRGSFS